MYKVNRYDCSRKYCIITNLGCNLECSYCYQHKNRERIFDLNSTMNRLIPVLRKKTEKGTIIKMLGGEPFLVFKQIRTLCDSIWEMNLPENYLFHTTSNGTIVHGSIQDWLLKHREQFTVKLSLDGNKEAHDINRSNSFNKIDLDFFKSAWPDIGVKMTISPQSVHFFSDSMIFLHEYGFREIKPNFAELVNWNQIGLYKSFYTQMEELKRYYLDNPEVMPCKFFRIPFRRCENHETVFHQCTIGERVVIDYNSGKNYPCVFFLPSVCGEKTSEELMCLDMKEKSNLVSGYCEDCPYLNICSTCYAANYMQRGHTSKRDMSICKLQKICFLVASEFVLEKYVYKKTKLPSDESGVRIYQDISAITHLMPYIERIYKEVGL